MYRSIEKWADLQDGAFVYNPGDTFPREGTIVSKARYEELAGKNNKIGRPLIVEIPDTKPAEAPAGDGGAETAKKPSRKRSSKK